MFRLKRYLPLFVIFVGIVMIMVAITADSDGLGSNNGFGKTQKLVTGLGSAFVFTGILLSISRINRFNNYIRSNVLMQGKSIDDNLIDKPGAIMISAVWFGLLTGLVEGILLSSMKFFDILRGSFYFLGSSMEILWISQIFNLVLFSVLGMALVLAAKSFPIHIIRWVSIFIFSLLLSLDWLAVFLVGRVVDFAIIFIALSPAIILTKQYLKNEKMFVTFCYRSLPLLAGFVVITILGVQGGSFLIEQINTARLPKAAPGSPNIIVIVIDALRADHLSGYGYTRPTSPMIDGIAEQGVRFDNAFSTSDWTYPSHVSLIRGDYQFKVLSKPLESSPTIAEVMRSHGYRTGAFSGNYYMFNRDNDFGEGFIHFEDYYRSVGEMLISPVYGRLFEYDILHGIFGMKFRFGRKLASDVNRSLLSWIDRDSKKPFFTVINYFDVHDPYIPPEPYRSMFSQNQIPGGLINSDWDNHHVYTSLTQEEIPSEMAGYDGGIRYVDDQIQILFTELQKRGLDKNTMIVILSDHGEMFGEHGLLEHANSLYLEVVKVPLIFWWPGHLPEGKTIHQPVSIAAIPATLVDLLNQAQQPSFMGPSLKLLWDSPGDYPNWPDPIIQVDQLDWAPDHDPTAHGWMFSIVTPRLQYIQHEKFGSEIYDWVNDPKEANNLISKPEMQPLVIDFKKLIQSIMAPN